MVIIQKEQRKINKRPDIDSYLNNLITISPLTVAKYRQCINTYTTWLNGRPISENTAREFFVYLKNKQYEMSTLNSYYHALKPFLKSHGIYLEMRFKRNKKIPDYHSVKDISAIIDCINQRKDKWHTKERDRLIVLLLAHTGMRRGELLNLRIKDIYLEEMRIKVTGKGNNDRMIPINSSVMPLLKSYIVNKQLKPHDRLIPLQPRRLHRIVKLYARLAGVENFHPHSFRHFFATNLVENETHLKTVQALLGHADISTTAVYLDYSDKHLIDAIDRIGLSLRGGKP